MHVDKYSCGTLPWIQVDLEDLVHLNFPVGKKIDVSFHLQLRLV